ncbi:MAG: hypothetical protein AAGH40_05230 [Verrucomicrobiota bacterium]
MKTTASLIFCFLLVTVAYSKILLTEDFESATAGAGGLSTTTPGFFVIAAGNSVSNIFFPTTDPITGVVNTSPISSGKAGYIGGTSTNLTFTSGDEFFNVLVFQTDPTLPSRNIIGTSEAKRSLSVEFAISLGGGSTNQAFSFYLFDGLDESTPGTFQYHSFVTILGNNALTYRNNGREQTLQSTGITLVADRTYRLDMEADYDNATWSAWITDLTTSTTTQFVTNSSINTTGFTLSGWTTPETIDIDTLVFGDLSTGNLLQNTIFFDNYVATVGNQDGIEITDFVYDDSNDTVTIEWLSRPNKNYRVIYTNDLETGFTNTLAASVTSGGSVTSIGPIASPISNATKLFFQVEEL